MYAPEELIPLSEVINQLESEDLKQGTNEFLEASRRFVETDMQSDEGEPLFFEVIHKEVNNDNEILPVAMAAGAT